MVGREEEEGEGRRGEVWSCATSFDWRQSATFDTTASRRLGILVGPNMINAFLPPSRAALSCLGRNVLLRTTARRSGVAERKAKI